MRRLHRLKRAFIAFVSAPWARRKLAMEAGVELTRARIQTLRATKRYISDLGELGKDPDAADSDQVTQAQEIGHMVSIVARATPFRAVCLQQAIAVRRMLSRRGIPAKVYLGLSTDAAQNSVQDSRDAHAWVQAGPSVVAGDQDLNRFAVVATFG